ncbi:MAG: mycofactocin biosynthesis peptidyl-dipeptidase MftE [Ferrimicrobium sp.]
MSELGALSSRKVAERASHTTLVVPIGSLEQHGPHLPIDTDTRITNALVAELERQRGEAILVAPTIAISASDEHRSFCGTLSIGTGLLGAVVAEIVRAAKDFHAVLLVSAHGGNAGALRDQGVAFWLPRVAILQEAARRWELGDSVRGMWAPDAHAGRTETSIMMAIAPSLVHPLGDLAGYVGDLGLVSGALIQDGVGAVSLNGVLGDPTGANQEEGLAILAAFSEDLVATFDRAEALSR